MANVCLFFKGLFLKSFLYCGFCAKSVEFLLYIAKIRA
ncbi:hypothetical protein JCM19233_5039 [Vibrio astriarenae]|nr:hypothetical protein JCM19233_5039 [Vibrio sp. C7]